MTLERHAEGELTGTRATGSEEVADAPIGTSEAATVQIARRAGVSQVGNIEEIEHFADELCSPLFTEAELFGDPDILTDAGIAGTKFVGLATGL